MPMGIQELDWQGERDSMTSRHISPNYYCLKQKTTMLITTHLLYPQPRDSPNSFSTLKERTEGTLTPWEQPSFLPAAERPFPTPRGRRNLPSPQSWATPSPSNSLQPLRRHFETLSPPGGKLAGHHQPIRDVSEQHPPISTRGGTPQLPSANRLPALARARPALAVPSSGAMADEEKGFSRWRKGGL